MAKTRAEGGEAAAGSAKVGTLDAISEFLEDGHPNPEFYEDNDKGYDDILVTIKEKDLAPHYVIYLYRIEPRRLDTGSGKPSRLYRGDGALPGQLLDYESIKTRYGGRKWTVHLNRKLNNSNRDRNCKTFHFDIERPAIWQDGEEPADPTPRRAANPAPEPAAAETAVNQNDNDVLKQLISHVLKEEQRAKEKGEQFDPAAALKNAFDIQKLGLEHVLQMIPKATGGGMELLVTFVLPLIVKLIDQMSNRQPDPLLKLLAEKALKEKEEEPKNDVSRIREILEIAGMVKGGGAPKGTDWAEVGNNLVDKLPAVLQYGAEMLRNAAILRTGARPQPQPEPAARQLPGAQIERPRAAQAADRPPVATAAESPEAIQQSIEAQNYIALQLVKQTIVKMLYNGDSGDAAAHVADNLYPEFAARLAEDLKAAQTDPARLKPLQDDAILSKAFEHLKSLEFAQHFAAYFEEVPEEAEQSYPAKITPIA